MHLLRTAVCAWSLSIALPFNSALMAGQYNVPSRRSGVERLPAVVVSKQDPPPTLIADWIDTWSPFRSEVPSARTTRLAAYNDDSSAADEGLAYTYPASNGEYSPYGAEGCGSCSGYGNTGYERPWGLSYYDIFPTTRCDPGLECRSAASDECPNWGVMTLFGYDSFRGVPQGGWGVYGGHVGFNLGTRLGEFSEWSGIGAQVGGTFGVFSWAGTDYQTAHQNQPELQGFVTYGLFHKATECSNWNAGVVQDWMFNDNFSVFAQNPSLSQLRGQLGYATSACNEFGVGATLRVLDDTRTVNVFGPTTWRPINQVNTYWHHKWNCGGPDTWIALGIPEQTRLTGGGGLGDWIASASAVCPFSDSVGLYVNVMYMNQSASAGDPGAEEDAWNFTTGVAFYPGHNARSTNVSGQRWMPLMPVANNGTFMVDASNWY